MADTDGPDETDAVDAGASPSGGEPADASWFRHSSDDAPAPPPAPPVHHLGVSPATALPPVVADPDPAAGSGYVPGAMPPAVLPPVPPVTPVPPVASTAYGSTLPATRPVRSFVPAGISWPLGLAVVLAGFPALLALLYGSLALLLADMLSDSSGSLGDSSSTLDDLSSAASGTGLVLLLLGAVGLVTVLMMASGSRLGRLLVTLWVVVLIVLAIAGGLRGDGVQGAMSALVAVAPGFVALMGMYAPSSKNVFD